MNPFPPPTLPVKMAKGAQTATVETIAEYWQRVWEGWYVEGTFVPDDSGETLTKGDLAAAFRIAPAPTGIADMDTGNLLAMADYESVLLRSGTYVVNQPIPVKTDQTWRGQGRTATTVKVSDGANCPAFRSEDFSTLTNTNVTDLEDSPYGFSIEHLGVDGNKSAQGSATQGIELYGHSFRLNELHIRNCKGIGLYHEFGFTGSLATDLGLPSYEPRVSSVDIHHCDSWGWQHRGPTDLLADRVLVWKCGLSGGTGGIWHRRGNGTNFNQCHTYGNVGWSLVSDAQFFATGCQIETGEAITGFLDCGGVWVRFDDSVFVGGSIYRISAAGVPLHGTGLRLGDQVNSKYAVRTYVATNILGFTGSDAAHAAIHFNGDSASNIVATVGMSNPDGSAFATTPVTGSPDPGSTLRIKVTGSSAMKRLMQDDRAHVGVKAVRTTDQTVPNNSFTNVAFNAADVFDTHSFHDPAGANERITVPTGLDGKYELKAAFSWDAASVTGKRSIRIRKNGATIIVRDDRNAAATGPTCQTITVEDSAAVGDYYEVQVLHDITGGGTLNSNVALGPVFFSARRTGG